MNQVDEFARLLASGMKSKRFRNKKTGEIKIQIPIMEIRDYEEID